MGPGGPQGPAGAAGSRIYSGSGNPPLDAIGDPGDYYFHPDTGHFFGPRTEDGWPAEFVSLKGTDGVDGVDGSQIFGAPDWPDVLQGAPGDYWLNTKTGQLWGPKTIENGWGTYLDLRGPKGDKGDKGDTGDQGPPGPENIARALVPAQGNPNFGESGLSHNVVSATKIGTGFYCVKLAPALNAPWAVAAATPAINSTKAGPNQPIAFAEVRSFTTLTCGLGQNYVEVRTGFHVPTANGTENVQADMTFHFLASAPPAA